MRGLDLESGLIDLTHGAGGRATARLVSELFQRAFANPILAQQNDAALLELAVRNLIDNARLHGGPHVSVRGWTRGARTGVDVEDDGDGISAANLPRVFDRFFTTGRDRQGTGLGLAIVRAVALVTKPEPVIP